VNATIENVVWTVGAISHLLAQEWPELPPGLCSTSRSGDTRELMITWGINHEVVLHVPENGELRVEVSDGDNLRHATQCAIIGYCTYQKIEVVF
jgi:hypothetical protein